MTLLEHMRETMHEIAARKGDFTLFALMMPFDRPFMRTYDPGTWDLVVSAPWLEGSKLKSLGELTPLLKRSLGSRAFLRLSGVSLVSGDDPRVKFILKNFPVQDGEQRIQDADLPGMPIERGIIFRAWRPEGKKPLSKHRNGAPAAALSRNRG